MAQEEKVSGVGWQGSRLPIGDCRLPIAGWCLVNRDVNAQVFAHAKALATGLCPRVRDGGLRGRGRGMGN